MPPSLKNITVLMPVYNRSKYVEKSIRSILKQTYKEFEFLIIDDGSTENIEETVSSFKDSRIIYKKPDKNKGTAAALNYGLKLAKGDWVARIDSDDLNTPDRLETQIKFLDENPEYDIVSCWSVYFKDPWKILFLLKEPVEHKEIYKYLNLHNPINQSGVIYRKKIIKREGYNENYLNNEDFELFYRIRDKVKFYNIPRFLVYTRVTKDSLSYTCSNKNVYDFLFPPAFKSLMESQGKGKSFFWASNIAWINYFYGNRKDSRSYFANSFSIRNILAYFTTLFPEKLFNKFLNSRIKYRFQALFYGKKLYRNELRELLG